MGRCNVKLFRDISEGMASLNIFLNSDHNMHCTSNCLSVEILDLLISPSGYYQKVGGPTLLAHEIGHLFGAAHDGADDRCPEGGTLMSPTVSKLIVLREAAETNFW